MSKKFRIYLWFVGWEHLSLGVSINYRLPDIELHLPFCFIKLGWEVDDGKPTTNEAQVAWREKSLI
jgi:hypothetical protein